MERLKSEHFDRLHPPVGAIMIQWGVMEIMLHQLGFAIFNVLNTTPAASGWPFQFSAKLTMAESLLSQRDQFKDLPAVAKPLFKKVRHLQELRDMLVHGAAIRYDASKEAILFRRIDRSTKGQTRVRPEISHYQNHMLVRLAELSGAADDCVLVNAGLVNLRGLVKALGVGAKKRD